jgi:hypothetical protein
MYELNILLLSSKISKKGEIWDNKIAGEELEA